MSLVIRAATKADLPAVKAMMRAFVDDLNAIDEPEEVPDEAIGRIDRLAFGQGAPCKILLCEQHGQPAGYLTYFWGMSMEGVAPALFVADLFVTHTHRRAGVGRALMRMARTIAADAGANQVNWTVWRKNTAAQAFYRQLGARPFDEEILMTWPVDPAPAPARS
jgi:GNAT superfamily N-acetyltransferase